MRAGFPIWIWILGSVLVMGTGCAQPARVFPLGGRMGGAEATMPMMVSQLESENAQLADQLSKVEMQADFQEEELIRERNERKELAVRLSQFEADANRPGGAKTVVAKNETDTGKDKSKNTDDSGGRGSKVTRRASERRDAFPDEVGDANPPRMGLTTDDVVIPQLHARTEPLSARNRSSTALASETEELSPSLRITPAPGNGIRTVPAPPPLRFKFFQPRRSWLTVDPGTSRPTVTPERFVPETEPRFSPPERFVPETKSPSSP